MLTYLVSRKTPLAAAFLVCLLLLPAFASAQTWLDPWQNRRPVEISNPCGEELENYQVAIQLDNSFNFANALPDGSDIRVTLNDGSTVVPSWIESWDPVGQTGTVWIKLSLLSVTGLTVYLYYGNASPPGPTVEEVPPVGPWDKQATNIVPIGDPSGGEALLGENIVYDDVTGHYWLLFAAYRGGQWVGLAYSDNPDDPTSWYWHGQVVANANAPHILEHDGLWYIFYADRSIGPPYPISVDTSSNIGGPYARAATVLTVTESWEAYRVDEPYVFQRNDGKWILTYMGDAGSTTEQVGYAESDNILGPYEKFPGNPCIPFGPTGSFDAGTVADPWVVEFHNTYYIGYTVSPTSSSPWRTAVATTTDWINFTKLGIILDLGSPGDWDERNAFRGAVTRFGDTYYFPYTGRRTSGSYIMGLATQPAYMEVPTNDPDQVFEFIDTFDDDMSKWVVNYSGSAVGASATITDGILEITAVPDNYVQARASTAIGTGTLLETFASHPDAGLNPGSAEGNTAGEFGYKPSDLSWTNVMRMVDWPDLTNYVIQASAGGTNSGYVVTGDTFDTDWHTFRLFRTNDDSIKFQLDDNPFNSLGPPYVPTIDMYPWLMSYTRSPAAESRYDIDWIRVRNYCGADAVAAVGPEEETGGALSGFVTADMEGLHGVYIDLFDSGDNLYLRAITDETGCYAFGSLPHGDYTVAAQMPMGFAPVSSQSVPFTISAGSINIDFALAEAASGSVTDLWWWENQFEAILAGTPLFLGITQDDIENYCTDVYNGYCGRDDGFEIQIEGVTYVDDPPRPLNFDDIVHIYLDPHDGTIASTIRRQLLIDMLNIASERLSQLTIVTADGATASQAILHYATRYLTDGSDDWTVWFYLSQIHQSVPIPAGQVPLTTANIMYGGNGDVAQPASIACPGETVDATVCGMTEVCVNLVIENYGMVTVSDGAVWADNQLCFTPDADSVFTFHVEATSAEPAYDPATCDISINVDFVGSPEITCPTSPVEMFTCTAGEICQSLPISNYDEVNVSYGSWAADELCIDADTTGLYGIDIEAFNECDTLTCTVYLNVEIGSPVVMTCPEDTAEVVICEPGEVCIDLPIDNWDIVTADVGGWSNHELCFIAGESGLYMISVIAANQCDTVDCDVYIAVEISPDVAIDCPAETIEMTAVSGQTCIDLPITGATEVDAGDAVWSDNSLCFDVTTSGLYEFTITAVNPCDTETCDISVDVEVITVSSLYGYVTGNASPLMGVYVNLFDSYGDPYASMTSDASGYYEFADIPNGDYTIEIQVPLGFSPVTPAGVPVTLAAAAVEVNFELTDAASGSVTDYWWWRNQFAAIRDGSPLFLGITLEDTENYCEAIFEHFYSRDDGYAIQIEGVTYMGTPAEVLSFDDLVHIYLDPHDGTNASTGRRHILTIILNVASERLSQTAVVSSDGATASQAITYFADWYLNGNPEDWQLWYYASMVHQSIPVPAGVIPLSTPNIMFKPEDENDLIIPGECVLYQNFPNPFNPITEIKFNLSQSSDVRLDVYNIMGQHIATLIDGRLDAGIHSCEWNAEGNATGVYFYRLKAEAFSATKKMILIK